MQKILNSITPKTLVFWLLLVITYLNLLTANSLGLSTDEAHYVLYGVHLDWSYYDHPPMVGWLQAVALVIGNTDVALRLWALLFNVLSSMALYRYTRLLFPTSSEWVASIAVIIFQSAIMLHLLGLALLPQVPFILFSLLAMLQLYKIMALNKTKLKHFLGLGLALGLAAISEYTAALLALVVVVYIFSSNPKLIVNYKLWLAGLLTLLCCFPIFYWNYLQHWASFAYQQHHVLGDSHWSFILFLQSQAVQCLAYSPGIYVFGLVMIVRGIKDWKDSTNRLAVIIAILWLGFFAYGSGKTFTLPHWTAVGWIFLFPLIAKFIVEHWQKRWVKISALSSLVYSIVLITFTYLQTFFHWVNLPLGQDPMKDLYGWRQAGLIARQELHKLPLLPNHNFPVIFVPNWSLASRIAWYSDSSVQVSEYQDHSQYFYWYGVPDNKSYGIMVVPIGSDAPAAFSHKVGEFKTCTLKKDMTYFLHGAAVNQFSFYDCRDYNT